jgi:hypothetical protein
MTGFESPAVFLARLVGLCLLSGVVAGLAAFLFRWRAGIPFPEGPALLLGLGAIAVSLNTRLVLVRFLGTDGNALAFERAVADLVVFALGGASAMAGWGAGDRLGRSERFSIARFQPRLSPLVRASGRQITVELPERIDDISGYDPVHAETKATLAGKRYAFPRGLTVDQLREALVERLESDHDIGHVDVELAVDGTVEHLGVGRRIAGIGPTLPPGTAATALHADPSLGASPGDTVQLWDGETATRLGTAELRAVADRVVTVSARENVIEAVDPRADYRLLTLSGEERVDRIFAGLLRRADETMRTVEIQAESTIAGMTVGDLGLSVIAVTTVDGTLVTIPERARELAAGESVFAVAHPTQLRRLEAAATGDTSYERPTATESPERRRRFRLWR